MRQPSLPERPTRPVMKGRDMGLLDDAKDVAEEAGHQIGEAAHDTKERISDKADEAKANSDVKAAEANRDSVEKKNELKEQLRD